MQLLEASTFIAECGQCLFHMHVRIYIYTCIQLIVPRLLPRVCVRLCLGGRLEAG